MRGRAQAREAGTLPFLAPGEHREYNFEVSVLGRNEEIDAMTSTLDGSGHVIAPLQTITM
jgi:hypothetical protein